VLLAALLAVVVSPPAVAGAADPDPAYAAGNVLQVFAGPGAPGVRYAEDPFANPYFMPDWDHDGDYGDLGDVVFDRGATPGRAPFRYPCQFAEAGVAYRTTTGGCARPDQSGVTFRTGEAQRLRVIDARGLALTATLWLPDDALRRGAHDLPGLVFASGAFVPQRSYYMYAMAAAAAGFVVLSYDSQGQGSSEGRFPWYSASAPASGSCRWTVVSCRELQEMVRWFTGDPIRAAQPRLGTHDPRYSPDGENPHNPALGLLDRSRVAIAGQSMGAVSVSNYLHWLPTGHDGEGQPLPAIAAAVALSGFGPASAAVPVQAQTADLDVPGVTADNWGAFDDVTDGPLGTKAWYDQLRARRTGHQMLQLIISEGGSHGDTADIPAAPHAPWAYAVSVTYFVAFLSCTVQHDQAACRRAVAPQPHLSQAYASEYVPAGTSGPAPSRCMTVPTKPSLEMAFDPDRPSHFADGMAAKPPYTCTP